MPADRFLKGEVTSSITPADTARRKALRLTGSQRHSEQKSLSECFKYVFSCKEGFTSPGLIFPRVTLI